LEKNKKNDDPSIEGEHEKKKKKIIETLEKNTLGDEGKKNFN